MVRSSGPVARKMPLFLIACGTIPGEALDNKLSSGHSLWSFSLTIRADGSLVWETSEVKLLSKSCCYFWVAGEGIGGKGDAESTIVSEGFKGGHPRCPHYAERHSLSDSKC